MVAFMLSSTIRRTGLAVLLCSLLAGCGASSNAPEVGQVSGTVKYKGEPVKEGQVVFEDPVQGQLAAANLKSDGTYVLTTAEGGLRVGTYGVTVTPVPFQADPVKKPPVVRPPDPVNIPKKYRTRATSKLTLKVESGSNTLDIEMAD